MDGASVQVPMIAALHRALQHPFYGTPIAHYRATYPKNEEVTSKPDYLAANPGDYGSGIVYVANIDNPLRGVFCQSPRKPVQEVAGIYYQAQADLYVMQDLGEVFALENDRPKRQDRFIINGQTYYAAAPSFPCMMGTTIALWKIDLVLERYPVKR